MKTTTKLNKIDKVFIGNFENKADVEREFMVDLRDVEVLLAYYTYEDYSGDAYVLAYDIASDKLIEVYGSHCSCYGLEGQWEPEDTTIQYLQYRLDSLNTYTCGGYKEELRPVVEQLVKYKLGVK